MSSSSDTKSPSKKKISDGEVRRSISIRLIRHGESQNNQVYRDARKIFRGGTLDFDQEGWLKYVDDRRSADPGLSDIGKIQAKKLAEYLEPHLTNQASRPVRFVVSPMRRTIETILPTLEALNQSNSDGTKEPDACNVMINGFYFESEGCHTREKVEPGMNAIEINSSLLNPSGVKNASFVGFPKGEENGWYANGTGAETRAESEERAAKFYVWMMEYLDQQLSEVEEHDIFDAGVTLPGEEHEQSHDRLGPRSRRRRTAIFVGHGDFMSLVLKRIMAGFGHAVEKESVPHRAAFVHFNTGITELEYFGDGRFLIMSQNHLPHLSDPEGSCCITGGSMKDGWSYLMPFDGCLDSEVSVAFSDEVQPHVQEQTEALRSLYLTKKESTSASRNKEKKRSKDSTGTELTIVVKRGLQVVGCASLNEKTGCLSDVVVRPSARRSQVGQSLIEAVKNHARESNIDTIVTQPNTVDGKEFFQKMGFAPVDDGVKSEGQYSSEIVRMECKL
eukprot:CAMPEP_0172322468 /NCGR_PEP_ID=MMETSP1058-20130122/45949_1 /TAXON_ID=83371 /ORGANISM="Detonula confervacea, Strain CCMP 353" /LENGTH=503 /DNA_ID=CAMNT_0013038215 /DNA_START=52 /DNA_END=1563 /DNA_ORIENTATION=-